MKDRGRESATYVANQRSSSAKEARESPVEYEARFRCDALPCVEGAGRFDGRRNLAALHAELVHAIGARVWHFHFECSARQLRAHGDAAFAEVTARAVSLRPRKAVLVTRSLASKTVFPGRFSTMACPFAFVSTLDTSVHDAWYACPATKSPSMMYSMSRPTHA